MDALIDSFLRVWNTFIDFEILKVVLPKLITQGLPNTLFLSLLSALIGTAFGVLLAAGSFGRRVIRAPVSTYTIVARALPAILFIYLVGQGLPLSGLKIFGDNTYLYAALGIGLMQAAYIGEIFRSGMQSVEKQYVESASSLGLSKRRVIWRVILPIGVRRMLPALTNQYILVIKATSLVYLLGLAIHQRDLFSIAKDEVALRGSFAPLVAAGVLYLAITLPLTLFVDWLDRRLKVKAG